MIIKTSWNIKRDIKFNYERYIIRILWFVYNLTKKWWTYTVIVEEYPFIQDVSAKTY